MVTCFQYRDHGRCCDAQDPQGM
eukprot:COSAG06_NODE_47750_length_337_cov_0.651261_1_plen_22_part_10